ncbi:MAG TPA: carboxymuconolactone decarboxylase family protein [Bauldia sp.]|nr:carboxymuconolactone decarboxylase family protein [Bauldia sp.]
MATRPIDAANPPTAWLAQVSPEGRDTYMKLRQAMIGGGPLDATTCEMINVVGLAIRGYEPSFRIHAKRLADAGVPKAAAQHAIISTLGATMVVFEVARALQWLDEVYPET